MATLEQLNFELILNDKAFNESIDAVIAKANSMNTDVSNVLDKLNKIGSGKALSASKKNEMLVSLKTQIKDTEAEIASLQQKLNVFGRGLAMDGKGGFANANIDKKFMEMSNQAEALRQKLELLRKTYKDLGGDVALSKSFPFAKTGDYNQELQLLGQQLKEQDRHYKEMAKSANDTANAQKRLTLETEKGAEAIRKQSRLWRDMKNVALAYFSFEGARRLVSNLVRVSAEFEKQRVSLHAILQDVDGAEKIFSQIKELAVQSPFQFKELVTYTKQLSAFSIPMNELYDTTKMLADVSAGLGVGMDRLVLAYGQIRSASFLRGQEVRQLTEAGIPILRELSDMFTELEGHYVSAGEVFDKISKRQVTFEMVEQVFKNMTTEGGKFYQMQEVLAQTLSGKISNLTDAYQIMFAEIGEKSSGVLYKSVDALRALAENYEKVGKALAEVVAVYGMYRAATAGGAFVTAWGKASAKASMMAILADGTLEAGARGAARGLNELVTSTKLYQQANAAVAAINPYALLAAAVVALSIHMYNLTQRTTEYEKAQKKVNDTLTEYNSKADGEIANLRYMFSRLEALNSESEEYKNIRKQIINQYGDYLSDIDKEKLAIGDLTGLYDKLADSVRRVSLEKAASAARDKVSEYVTEATADVREKFNKALEQAGYDPNGKIANELRTYIFGNATALSQEAEKAANKIGRGSWWRTAGRNIATALLGEFNIFFDQAESVTIDKLKHTISLIGVTADDMLADSEDSMKWLSNMFGDVDKETEKLDGWRLAVKNIAEEAKKMKAATGIEIDASSELIDVYDQIAKAADKAASDMERYRLAGEKDLYETEKNRLAYLNSMKARLGGDTGGGGGGGQSGDPFREDVEKIESEIRVYQKLQDVYKSLVEYMSDEQVRKYMSTFFPQYGDMVDDDYEAEIQRLSLELGQLALVNEGAAKAWLDLQDALSQSKVNNLLDAKRAAEEYANFMENWLSSSEMFGEGAEFNISVIVGKYKKNIQKLLKEKDKALDMAFKAYASGENGLDYFEEEGKIIEGYLTQSDNELRKANEDIRKQAELWVKNWGKINSIDISHMADLTEHELEKLLAELAKLSEHPELYFSKELTDSFNDVEGSLEIFVNAVKEYVSSLTDEGQEKSWDKLVAKVKRFDRTLRLSTKSLKELSDAAGWAGMSDLADHINRAAEGATKFVEALAKGDPGEAIFVAVTYMTEEILHAVTAAIEYRNTIRELQREMRILAYESRLSAGVDTIFGTDTYASLKNAVSLAKQLQSAMRHLSDTLSKIKVHVDHSKWWQYILAPTAPFAWYEHFFGKDSISDILGDMGQSLFDANGRVNVDALKNIESSYKKMSEAQRQALNDAIADAEAYNKALDQIDETMESLVGSVADDFADAIINQWKEAGDAALDYGDILDDLANNYAKMFVRNAIMEELFDKDFQKQITNLTLAGRAADVLAAFDEKASQLADIMPTITSILEGLGQYFNGEEKSSSNTLGGGIKSITEDTANLLASYVNAIRADVAAIRQAVVEQNGQSVPAPTLAEYLTQIQANTYNNAVAAQNILQRLDSVMTVSDGPAFRVFM